MIEADVRAAIETFLAAQWSATAIVWPNTTAAAADSWISPHIRAVDGAQEVLTGSTSGQRFDYLLIVQVFTKGGIGAGAADALVDALSAIFNSTNLSTAAGRTIHFDVPVTQTVGSGDGLFQKNVRIPFFCRT